MSLGAYDNLRITGRAVYDELTSRGIEVKIIDAHKGLLRFSHRGKSRYVQSCLTDDSSAVGRNIANNKIAASTLARTLNMRLPEEVVYTDTRSAQQFLSRHRMIVVKPTDGAHGKGVSVGVTTMGQLSTAVKDALAVSESNQVILQQQIRGDDIRILIIDRKLAAASLRSPATVIGDGASTIEQLVTVENNNILRGTNYAKPLNKIDVEAAESYIGGSFENVIPKNGQPVQVAGTANIGTGGKATDITDKIPEAVVEDARRIADELKQRCCGVDYIAGDLLNPESYYFIEINASPSFGLHMCPSEGKPRAVQQDFVDMLISTQTDV
jgi:cyanophycin synthetase